MFIYVNTGVIYSINRALTLGLHRQAGFGEQLQTNILLFEDLWQTSVTS